MDNTTPFRVEQLESLTPKERKVLQALHHLGSIQGVANSMGNQVKTIDLHLAHAKEKLGCVGESSHRVAALYVAASSAPPSPPPEFEQRSDALKPRRRLPSQMVGAFTVALLAFLGWYALAQAGTVGAKLSVEQIESHLGKLGSNSSGGAEQQANLVGELMDHCWQEMWGPKEEYLVAVIERQEPHVRNALAWAKLHDPDLAVRIMGNGHRVMSRSVHFSDWVTLLNQAVEQARSRDSLAYGRALCGLALANWDKAPGKGLEAAHGASRIFADRADSRWDYANALRHKGLCYRNRPLTERIALYKEALEIYRAIGEPRGEAQCLISLAQAGYSDQEDPVVEGLERLAWAADAIQAVRPLANTYLRSECIQELFNLLNVVPLTAMPQDMATRIRKELFLTSELYRAEGQFAAQLDPVAKCLEIDLHLASWKDVVSDLEALLLNPEHSRRNLSATKTLITAYVGLCRKQGRPLRTDIRTTLPQWSPPSHLHVDSGLIVKAARNLTKE